MRDNKRYLPSLFVDSLSYTGMFLALMMSVFASLTDAGQSVCFTSLFLVGAFCSSLVFGLYNNQRRSQAIETGKENTGEVVYTDTCGHTWFLFLYGILTKGLIGIPWFIVLYILSYPLYPIALGIWMAWVLCTNLLFPVRYTVTTKGIWTRLGTIHSFVYFEDLEHVCREPGMRLVWPSDNSNPIVRLSDYVILSIKPERKLLKESQKKHLTPSNPLGFMAYLPSRLIMRSHEK